MLNIGDIVKPKEGFKGSKYMFKIEERDESNYPYMYRLERVEQELDTTYGPIDFQRDIIRDVEHLSWSENELELIAPFYDVKPLVIKNKNLFNDLKIEEPDEKDLEFFKTMVKGEFNNMKILDIYKERKEEAILEDYEKKEEAVLAEDEMQKIIKEMTDQVNALLESENRTDFFYVESEGFTLTETNEKLDKLNEEKEDEILQLDKTIEEIEAMFEMTEDYEERMKILKKYGIINKDGKLNI
jgi:hypothetical protein